MVRRKRLKQQPTGTEAAHRQKARQVRGRPRANGVRGPKIGAPALRRAKMREALAVPGQSPFSEPQSTADEAAIIRRGERLRWVVIVVGLLALGRLFFSDGLRGSLGLLPLPTWEWDVAAVTPLLALLLFRDAERRGRIPLLSGELQYVSGFYLLYAVPGALTGHSALWPAVASGITVICWVSYTNGRSRRD